MTNKASMSVTDEVMLLKRAIREWNELAGDPIGTDTHQKQIRAFILGKGDECNVEDVLDFIHNDMLD